MDLPCEDRTASFFDYSDAVRAALGDASEVVLVGHSMAGITIPLVALSRPVRLLVFLCALVPDQPGDTTEGGPQTHPDGAFDALVRHEDGSHSWPSAETAARTLYQDCRPELVDSAFARLRPQQTALWDGWSPIERWPEVAIASIHCRDDRAVNPAWSSWIARNRLGVRDRLRPGLLGRRSGNQRGLGDDRLGDRREAPRHVGPARRTEVAIERDLRPACGTRRAPCGRRLRDRLGRRLRSRRSIADTDGGATPSRAAARADRVSVLPTNVIAA